MNKNKIKIAQVVCVFPPYAGGIGTAAANISKFLAKAGHSVTVFTPAYKNDYKLEENVDGYSIKRFRTLLKYGNAAVLLQLVRELKYFDIVHLHLPFLGSAEVILLLNILSGKKLHIVAHYHMDLFGRNKILKAIFNFEQKVLIPAEIEMSRKTIISSNDYVKHSKIAGLYGRYPQKFVTIPYGIDTNLFHATKKDTALVKKYMLEDKKVIIFVGGLDDAHYFKGVNFLLEAFSKLSHNDDYRLLIIGKGNLKESYEKMAKDLKIDDKTIFTGFVSDDDLPKFYNVSDISVLPSINSAEAFGIVLLEAMACGKPTVATNLPGVREVFGEKQKIISVRPSDSVDLSNKINLIFTNKKLYDEISKSNVKRTNEEYSWKVISDKLIRIYQEML